ncbi:MAG: hypothetical protein EBR29_03290, partial [Sphingobacteriia bacterium]|nr:hypothetical protein [Sphingobacteriia bacterium]
MNNPAMTDHVQQCLQLALQTVDQEKHGYVQTPHLLEALFEVDRPWLLSIGRELKIDTDRIRQLNRGLLQNLAKSPKAQNTLDAGANQALVRAQFHRESMGDRYIGTEHLLMGLAESGDACGEMLRKQGLQ